MLDDPNSELILPIIVLAEACWLVERGRSSIPAVANLLDDVDNDSRMTIAPLDRPVLERSLTLSSIPEMHDRLIVATALVLADLGESVTILSRDDAIRRSGLVAVVW